MSSMSGSTWIVVDDSNNRQPRRQVSENNLRAPRPLDLVSVSPQELQQQQELLEHYKNKQRLERIRERPYPAESSQQPAITPSGFRRRLESLPCVAKITSNHSRMITTSSTDATVGAYVPPEGPTQVSAPPPLATARRRKRTAPQPASPDMPSGPTRAISGPAYLQPSKPGMLNVNTIGGSSPPMPIPQLPHYHSAPAAVQAPIVLPLESLPPGYDFAISQFRSENTLRPLRLLSLDGGGVRGISSLRILKAIMDRIKPGTRPCEYFDLIAGTSTGGLIAIMLGRLRMSVDECIQHYHRLSKRIFKRNPAAQLGSLAVVEHRFSPDNLEEAIKAVVATSTPHNTKMADSHPRCARTFVLAVRKHNVNNQGARRIRSYATKSSPADTCEIWEAGRATSAAPSYFPPIRIPDEKGKLRSYVDGGLGYNNPCKELLNEAREVFGPEHSIGCFVSIGTGRDRNIAFNDVRKLNSAYKAFKAIALSSQQAHREIEEYFSRMPGVYYRFNAGQRLIGTSGDEDFVQAVDLEDWHKMNEIETMTSQYLGESETTKQVKRCAAELTRITRTHEQQSRS